MHLIGAMLHPVDSGRSGKLAASDAAGSGADLCFPCTTGTEREGRAFNMTIRFTIGALALGASALFSAQANAAACTGVSVGTSSTADFTLGGADASACVISTANPDQGPNGNSSGFSPSPFGTGWTLLAKVNSDTSPSVFNGTSFSWSLAPQAGTSGEWSFGANKSVQLDLVLAMHASNRSGAFLFEDVTLTANSTKGGTWEINWLNAGGQVPGYSNSSLWVRNVTAVPEPEAYALAVAGLGMLAFVARRRRRV